MFKWFKFQLQLKYKKKINWFELISLLYFYVCCICFYCFLFSTNKLVFNSFICFYIRLELNYSLNFSRSNKLKTCNICICCLCLFNKLYSWILLRKTSTAVYKLKLKLHKISIIEFEERVIFKTVTYCYFCKICFKNKL